MRKSLSYGLLLVVLLGSVGFPLYKHTCLHDNVTISTLFVGSDHCSSGHEKEEPVHCKDQSADEHECCAPVVRKEVAEDGCCSESMAMLSMSFNFFQHIGLSPFIAPEIQKSADLHLQFIPVAVEEKQILYSSTSDPPRPGGKQILKENCIWII